MAPSSRRCASALRISRLYSSPETLLHFGTVAFATTPVPAASAGAVRIRTLASPHSRWALPQTALGKVSSSSTYLRDTRRGKCHGKGREASPPPPFSANPTRRAPRQEATPARRTHSFWQSHSPPASQPVSQSSAAFNTASKPRLYDDTSAVSRLHLGCVSAASPARAAPRPVLAARQHPKHAQPEAVLLRQRGGRRGDGVIGRRWSDHRLAVQHRLLARVGGQPRAIRAEQEVCRRHAARLGVHEARGGVGDLQLATAVSEEDALDAVDVRRVDFDPAAAHQHPREEVAAPLHL